VDRALDAGGQRPAYLDTKATILLQQGKPQDAVALLEKAVSGPERDPVHQLHLAVAYARAGRDEDARKAHQTALVANVRDGHLTETDLSLLTELEKKFQ
jgi:Flp pilus assembly protein TadD